MVKAIIENKKIVGYEKIEEKKGYTVTKEQIRERQLKVAEYVKAHE